VLRFCLLDYIARESVPIYAEGMGRPQHPRRSKPKGTHKVEPTLETARTPGERIRALYLAKGLNRSQLQRALGCAYTTILAWEEDRYVPGRDHLAALSVLLGVPPSVVLGEDEPVTEAQYEAWGTFLKTSLGESMNKHERIALGSMRFADDDAPTLERYSALLFALRGSRSRGSA
jgi:transcriptional regulator with XRE-family HTH domain